MCQNHCVFSAKVARPTVSRARERSDSDQVRSLCIKVASRFVRDLGCHPRAPYQHRQNPFIASSVWGIYCTGDTVRSKWLLGHAFEATVRSKWLLGHAFEATVHS